MQVSEIPPYSKRNSLALGSLACGSLVRPDSSALLLPTAIDEGAANSLDKIGKMCNVFALAESCSCSPKRRKGDEKPRLSEALAHNLRGEPELGANFFI